MRFIGRRMCGCDCAIGFDDAPIQSYTGTGSGTPEVRGWPSLFSPGDPNGPCWYDVDFNCYITCDGLTAGEGVKWPDVFYLTPSAQQASGCSINGNCATGPLSGRALTRLYKDRCTFEASPVSSYTSRKALSWSWTGTGAGGSAPGPVPPQPGANYSGSDVSNYLHGACGWQHRTNIDCAQRTWYPDFLANGSRVTWDLRIDGTTATLTGTTDSNDTAVYYTSSWQKSLPGDYHQNTMALIGYPKSFCVGLPPYVCVYPGDFTYRSKCGVNDQLKSDCCHPEDNYMCFIGDYGPGGCLLQDVVTQLTHHAAGSNASGADNVGPPSDVTECGYYWGFTEAPDLGCADGNFALGLQTWCDGVNWKQSVWCAPLYRVGNHNFSKLGESTGTRVHCCPYTYLTFSHNFPPTTGTGTGTGTGQSCCCDQGTPAQTCCMPASGSGVSAVLEVTSGPDVGFSQTLSTWLLCAGSQLCSPSAVGFNSVAVSCPGTGTPKQVRFFVGCQNSGDVGIWQLRGVWTGASDCPTFATAQVQNTAPCPALHLEFTFSCSGCANQYKLTVTR